MSSHVTCPQCSKEVSRSTLAAHLHRELGYHAWRCGICLVQFSSLTDAKIHFTSVFSPHAGVDGHILETHDPDKLELLTSMYTKALEESADSSDDHIVIDGGSKAKRRKLGHTEEENDPSQAPLSTELVKSEEELSDSSVAAEAPPSEPSEGSSNSEAVDTRNRFLVRANGRRELDKATYPCKLCGRQQAKNTFQQHAFRSHVVAKPFLCELCSYAAKDKRHVIRHQKKAHPGLAASVTNLMESLRTEIRGAIQKCFGSTAGIPKTTSECRSCRVRVRRAHPHIAAAHIKRDTSACRLCEFTTQQWGLVDMRKHMNKEHGETLSSANYEDLTPGFVHLMRSLKDELFGKGSD